jgi:hypothetical protein
MHEPVIISFYTDDSSTDAEHLIDNCKRLGLDFHIEQVSIDSNLASKSFFIRDRLQEFQRPVMWVDVSGTLLQNPGLEGLSTDFAACQHPEKEQVNKDWSLGILWFNYTSPALDFLDVWCSTGTVGTDEESFDVVWKSLRGKVMPCILPTQYHVTVDELPADTIFCNRKVELSDSSAQTE